jgi:Sulfotransferase family
MKEKEQISRMKKRMFRFSNNHDYHVISELIEYFANVDIQFSDDIVVFIRNAMFAFKNNTTLPDYQSLIPYFESNGFEIQNQLSLRASVSRSSDKCEKYVHIIGAPRSGTSYLYNLLAFQKVFAYFTCDSHSDWNTYNFNNSGKVSFENTDIDVLTFDTKRLKLRHDIRLPIEGENIWNQSMPCYNHLGSHKYQLFPCKTIGAKKIENNISSHCAYFDKKYFLSKSPFNAFRTNQLSKLSVATYFIHIYRDKKEVADSIRRNNFFYKIEDADFLSPDETWELFTQYCLQVNKNILKIHYKDLVNNPVNELRKIFDWLNIVKDKLTVPKVIYQKK